MHATLIVSCHQIVLILIHPRSDVTNVASAAFCQHHHFISPHQHIVMNTDSDNIDNCQSRNLLLPIHAAVVLLPPAP